MMGENYTLSDIAAVTGRDNGNGFGNGDWGSWIILFLIFGLFGRGGFGGYGGGYGGGGVGENYVLSTDFATIERKLDGINNGLCDGFYAMNTGMLNGFGQLQQGIMQTGYNLSSQLAGCCCDIREGIQANTTQGILNTNQIQQQIAACCCDNEKMAMQNRFDMAQYNCNTLQAIDKVGDRIIDYLSTEKNQALRDENFALRLAASQQAQNAYLVNQLNPCPVPAYITCNPRATTNCGCGCGF